MNSTSSMKETSVGSRKSLSRVSLQKSMPIVHEEQVYYVGGLQLPSVPVNAPHFSLKGHQRESSAVINAKPLKGLRGMIAGSEIPQQRLQPTAASRFFANRNSDHQLVGALPDQLKLKKPINIGLIQQHERHLRVVQHSNSSSNLFDSQGLPPSYERRDVTPKTNRY